MSPLALIQRSIQRKQRQDDARFLMAKAYRGIDYTSAHQPPITRELKQLTYRGLSYDH
jgi:hypothetical protein